jgi:hypothetical protein
MSTGLPRPGSSGQLVAGRSSGLRRVVGVRRRGLALVGVNSGSPMPAMVRPSTVVILLSSTIALRWRATADWMSAESWLPRT